MIQIHFQQLKIVQPKHALHVQYCMTSVTMAGVAGWTGGSDSTVVHGRNVVRMENATMYILTLRVPALTVLTTTGNRFPFI